jgi:hypothetical protein
MRILGISIVLFIVGLVLHLKDVDQDSASNALLTPLSSLLIFRAYRRLFIICFKHEPRDTFNDWNPDKGEDRVFNILYVVSVVCLLYLSFGVDSLTRFG